MKRILERAVGLAIAVLAVCFVISETPAPAAATVIDFTSLPWAPGNGEITGTEWHSLGLDLTTTTLAFNVGCGGTACLGADSVFVNDFDGIIVGTFVVPSTTTPAAVSSLSISYCCEVNSGSTNTLLFDPNGSLLATFIDTDVAYAGLPVGSFQVDFGVDAMYSLTFDGLQQTAVPEPASLLLLGSGLVGLGAWRYRKRTKVKSAGKLVGTRTCGKKELGNGGRLMKTIISLLVIGCSLVFVPVSFAVPVWQLSFHSEPGDWIGQGQDVLLSSADGPLSFITTFDQTGDGLVDYVRFIDFDPTFWILDIASNKLGVNLAPGFYPDAQRAAFAAPGHPGLDFSFDHRGSNTLTGNFTIFDVFFDYSGSSPKLIRFNADFEQHSEGLPPGLFGHIEYRDTVVPEPASLLLMGSGLAGLAAWRRKRG